ncbi:MAG TPA: arylsulfatase [Acidobacteriaceae bacterium]|nr:arylsulfatase [Acidobacteriaceae bacterium]
MARYSQVAPGMIATMTLLLAGCHTRREATIAQREVLPKAEPSFTGVMSEDPAKARAAFPPEVTAPPGAPNVLLILVDDVGFSATATFGGVIHTPNFDRLAAAGLKYNNFHVNALCSPTRSALLSGRNNHQVGFGNVAESVSGFPGYNGLWPRSAASVAEVLKDNGYATAAFGKWHNTPIWQTSRVGPFDRWPTGLGFQHFYGFLAGYDNQYFPRLFDDTVPVEPAKTPQQGYSLTADMTDHAIFWLHQLEAVAPQKPFFLYYAPGATHTPHQVPKEWIAKYKGKFDEGWDKLREETFARQKKLGVIPANSELTPRPEGLPAWDSLPEGERKLLARQAEVYAAFTEQTDYQIGRLIDEIGKSGKADNTLVIEIFGDNGASAEGGPDGYDARDAQGKALSIQQRLNDSSGLGSELYMNHFAAAWAWALSTPFQGAKMDASHLGGTTDPMVVSWPARIHQRGELRTQFQHVTDIVPTIYEAAGVKRPDAVNGVEQMPLEGTSLVYTFDHPDAPTRHTQQYFATLGNIAIYKDGWWAGRRAWSPWEARPAGDLNKQPWELYHLSVDYSQAHDLAQKDPEKLNQLKRVFDEEAKRNQVYPLFPLGGAQPLEGGQRKTLVLAEGAARIPNATIPHLAGRAYTITADIVAESSRSNGVIVAQGSRYGGFTLYLEGGHVVYEVNAFGNRTGRLVSKSRLQPGKAHIVLEVNPEGPANAQVRPGTATLTINGEAQGTAIFPNLNGGSYTETLDVGSDLGSPVSTAYTTPDIFSGRIDRLTIEIR